MLAPAIPGAPNILLRISPQRRVVMALRGRGALVTVRQDHNSAMATSAAKTGRRLTKPLFALAHGFRPSRRRIEILAVGKDGVLRVFTFIYGTFQLQTRMLPAQALSLGRVPVQNREFEQIAMMTWAQILGNMQAALVRGIAASASEVPIRGVSER